MGRRALIVSLESCRQPEAGAAALANATAAALAGACGRDAAGPVPAEVLADDAATKTAVLSRLRVLGRESAAGDSLLLFWVGPCVTEAGQNYLPAWDARPDDLLWSAVPLADLLDALRRLPCPAALLLDAVGDFDPRELDDLDNITVLTSHTGNGSQVDRPRGRRVWPDLIGRALGEAGDGPLSAADVHRWAVGELPRAARRATAEPAEQTPGLFGDAAMVLWQRPDANAGLEAGQVSRLVFAAEERRRVKTLAGFKAYHQVPDRAGPSGNKFLAKLALDDLRTDIDAAYNALRDGLGYKRKDLEASVESDGTAFIRTPDFDYLITAVLDEDDPTLAVWRQELTNLSGVDVIRSAGFDAAFGATFDRLELQFGEPLDVDRVIDELEESPPAGAKVRAASDGSSCQITLSGFAGSVTLTARKMTIEGRTGQKCSGLLEQFLLFQERFHSGGRPGLKQIQ